MTFPFWLGLLFIALKLLEIIDWSWWLVLLPLYFLPVIAVVLLIIGVVGTSKRLNRRVSNG